MVQFQAGPLGDYADESDLQRFLEKNKIGGKVIALPSRVHTVEEAAKLTGVNKDDIVKSLVFLSSSGEAIIAIVGGDTRLDERKLAAAIKASGVTKATPSKILQETGYPVGGVPPVGHRKSITTVIDKKVLEKETVYAGGGSENHLLRISPKDIASVQNAAVADIRA